MNNTYINYTTLITLILSGNKIDIKSIENEIKKTDQKSLENALSIVCANSSNSSNNEVVKLLLDNFVDPNSQDNDGLTALMIATKYIKDNSNIDTIKLLLKYNADPNMQNNNGWTALMTASKYINSKSLEAMKILLESGANVNLQKKDGSTALMIACLNSNIDAAQLLLKYNADIKIKNNCEDDALIMAGNAHDINYDLINLLVKINKNISKNCETMSKCNDQLEGNNSNIVFTDFELAEHNFNILANLKYPEKLIITGLKLNVDQRWFQSINRYWTKNTRKDLIEPLQFTFNNQINKKSMKEFTYCLNNAKNVMIKLYPEFKDLHDLFDEYLFMQKN